MEWYVAIGENPFLLGLIASGHTFHFLSLFGLFELFLFLFDLLWCFVRRSVASVKGHRLNLDVIVLTDCLFFL